ncbi:CotH kinase family protein [Flavobacterium sp.]|uniref:CotH kinase family protein n=1 Tax=Flavobacterium sp. TaxID=239 RepID=UPI0028BEB15E|nr:CotH kinase family protein [Flavobacterium sp.]
MKKITFYTTLGLILLNTLTVQSQNLVINEILSTNVNSLTDENNDHEDWVELYNNGASPIGLLGHGLTDDPASPFKWTFPQVTLNPGEYLLIWCSDKNRRVPGSPLHTNFKISSSGETVVLTNPSGTTLQTVNPVSLQSDVSYGRFPNATGAFTFFLPATPNAVNNSTTYAEVLSEPVFSQNSGFYTSGFNLSLSSAEVGTTIIYTLDGSEPNENNLSGTTYSYKVQYPELPGQAFGSLLQFSFTSLQYSAPIPIIDRSSEPNKISTISTTWDFVPPYIPNGPIFKGTVVKAKVIKPGALTSPTVTKNYFISPQGVNRFTLPVISVSLDENSFYDYTDGISVAGIDFDTWRAANPTEEVNENLGNFNRSGDAYERLANLNYFVNGQEVINQKVGIRIHGDYSRQYPSKSMRVYARSSYGKGELDYPLFSDQPYPAYERVIIKNSGSDFYNTMFRDALCNELVKDLRMETEASQQVITFINGEYWGILALRERYDNNYFKLVYDINNVDLLENDGEVKEGDDVDYLSLINYFETNDLAIPANYDYIKTRIDPDSFIDYFISNIYLENDDWPSNNIVYWRKKTAGYIPTAPYGHDGRWRWAYHDVTSTFGNPEFNSLEYASTDNIAINDSPWSTLLLRKLLANTSFKNEFINRFADLMNTNFLANRINSQIDVMAAEIAPEMNDQYFRWKGPEDDGDWQYHINEEKLFANQRAVHQRTHIREKFSIASNLDITLNVSDANHGFVKINTINIKDGTPGIIGNPYPWTGIYFHNIPITVKAVPLEGYVFDHWSGDSTSTEAEITLTPTGNLSLTAHFSPDEPTGSQEVVYFWMMDTAIPNDTPLTALNSSYEISTNAVLNYQSCLVGYPFNNSNPNWRKASMERRNSPTELNYIPSANNNLNFANSNMRGLQVTQPFQSGNLENTMVFNVASSGHEKMKFGFAVKDEGAATGLLLDYSINVGAPTWTTAGMPVSAFPINGTYQLIEADFSSIPATDNNADFKIRIRFTGPNMMADTGERVTFNNISVKGMPITLGNVEVTKNRFLIYPNPVGNALQLLHDFATVQYVIRSLDGKEILSGMADDKVEVNTLASGIYLITFQTEDGIRETQKFVKR